jgi:hypothetical protein
MMPTLRAEAGGGSPHKKLKFMAFMRVLWEAVVRAGREDGV